MKKIILAAVVAACAASGAMAGQLRIAVTSDFGKYATISEMDWSKNTVYGRTGVQGTGTTRKASAIPVSSSTAFLNEDAANYILTRPDATHQELTEHRIKQCKSVAKYWSQKAPAFYESSLKLEDRLSDVAFACVGVESGNLYGVFSQGNEVPTE